METLAVEASSSFIIEMKTSSCVMRTSWKLFCLDRLAIICAIATASPRLLFSSKLTVGSSSTKQPVFIKWCEQIVRSMHSVSLLMVDTLYLRVGFAHSTGLPHETPNVCNQQKRSTTGFSSPNSRILHVTLSSNPPPHFFFLTSAKARRMTKLASTRCPAEHLPRMSISAPPFFMTTR